MDVAPVEVPETITNVVPEAVMDQPQIDLEDNAVVPTANVSDVQLENQETEAVEEKKGKRI